MKKLGLLFMPLMAVSLLASCEQPKQVVQHIVTFESNGGSHINTQRVDDGGVATNPGESTRPGYRFEGWYTTNPNPEPIEEDKYNFDTKVTNDITLYAGWTPIHYNFSFNGTGCTILNDYQYTEDIDLGSNRKFTIVPDSEHTTLLTVQITKGDSCAIYENGIITIVNMDSDVEVVATAEERKYFDVSVSGEHIHYYKDSAFKVPLESVKVKKGENFVFYMLGEGDVTENSEGYVPPTSLTIKIKDKIEDECYEIEAVSGEYENLLKKVTIYSDYIVDDIIIQGDGVKKDYYQMRLPYLIGLKKPEIQNTFFEYDKDVTFEFIAENSSTNAELLTAENIFVNLDGKEQEWISPSAYGSDENVTFEHNTDNNKYYLHIKANAVSSDSTNIINVVARAKAVSILNSVGWNDISRASEKGYAPALFDIGDTKNVLVDETNIIKVRIIDFNKDYLADSTNKAGITFDFVDVIQNFTTHWNDKNGFESANYNFINKSNLNDCLQPGGRVYKMIDPNLTAVIKTVNKTVDIYSDGKWVTGNYDTQLFPFSRDEIDGNDGGTYEYFKKDSQNRRKKNLEYWLRSPHTNYNNHAWYVSTDGYLYDNIVCNHAHAVAPAFCI